MKNDKPSRVMVNLPGDIGDMLRRRAKENYRSTSAETVMLIERGLAAEKLASGQA
ncbi:hypothetical protein [Novosphingobium capsulatum]|uniref:hypothetical protein n=1 Tax=Novosphingobium capsulatum TaxID=13688 RepID=UPI000A4B5FA0|nr:hypothetical protein [Novosphingobium capsulatum]WQD92771.1 hypothetical protein U0041_17580 [Novosphingobium capsulatum]